MSLSDPHASSGSYEPRDVRTVLNLAAVLVGATVSLTFMQVLLRYIFASPYPWAEEVSRYLFVWITFLGASIAFWRDTHIRVDAVAKLFGQRIGRGIALVRRGVEYLAIAVLLYAGLIVAWRNRNASFYTIPDAPQVLFYLSVPTAALLMVYYGLRRLARRDL